MSGFEIVGVVLGGIPIVLEAYNRYQAVSTTLTSTLSTVTQDAEKARSLISGDGNWDALGLEGLDLTRLETMRDALDSWKDTLDVIHDSLQAICSEIDSFRVSPCTKPTKILSMEILRKQFKLFVKKDTMQEAIEDLRNFTADFNRITSQIIDELKDPGLGNSSLDRISARIKPSCWNSLKMYQQIRAASSSLYEALALRWPCALHQRHMASIAFQEGYRAPELGKGIKFEAVVTPSESEAFPLWLEIECINDTRTSQPTIPSVTQLEDDKAWVTVVDTLNKHSQAMVLDSTKGKPKKLTKQQIPSQMPKTPKVANVVPVQILSWNPKIPEKQDTANSDETPLTNMEIIGDICHHFQTTH
ncbi:hypothetical protein FGSG_00120 [Fusarium graminearum PH-1]|uniref:Chromosome 1, complete genome n=1 Tax=Gibberella zeae (strain ATCC MYA-4620 / CBS 123657 / FGSC 9075 / NRRL 31084 / PH-1) TaxID=229533 RepID=I1R9H9_GIBZE|nr:hypothetical protein FGSG_00120 [Fusarium graminearum PH-1]ESU05237.1 hypothetical protein FGSG_00120 [Fusarium graminearum PH-1]CEF71967.1 unnamed protein product [Fusarium graminearum]|eukprot:XP_011315722.1 hypothetical protein FGSG_00120 [Fusarium graminearum PH-1]